MQSTHKIAGGDAGGLATYLTSTAARGDYYLGAGSGDGGDGGGGDGVGAGGAAGRWHGSPGALSALGLSADRPVERGQLLALMGGLSPASGEPIRRVGGDGSRVAGVDVTLSAPKSVSALWAVASPYRRAQVEVAHRRAVASTMARVVRDVELVRTRRDGVLRWGRAESLAAAEFVHTSSRLTRDQERGGVPDPQLHSHVVVLAARRVDGRFAAVDSRELFRSARANGAWYRAELAANLAELGLVVQGRTGNDGRYFEVAGVPRGLTERWSARSVEIERAAREFRGRYGRDPRGGEISSITVATRGTKTTAATVDVDAAWRAVGGEHGLGRDQAEGLFNARGPVRVGEGERPRRLLAGELVADLTARASMVSERDLHARAFELAAANMRPEHARDVVGELERTGELVRLEGGMWTTRQLRDLELETADAAQARAGEAVAPVGRQTVGHAAGRVEREIGGKLSGEQCHALEVITGPGGVVVLEGQAGSGKGVVLRAAAKAWQSEGYTVLGTAVAGATAERLAAEAGIGRSRTADSVIASSDHGTLRLDQRSVLVMDEAGMADTRRLARLVEITGRASSKLVLVGDASQLSPIGAGGLFEQVRRRVPAAQLAEVRRARHGWEREAWGQIRDGEAHQALASYSAHGRLHVSETRQQAAERMVAAWDAARRKVGVEEAVMLTDASNTELDQINKLAQQARQQAGELGEHHVPLAGRPYGLAEGDRVIFTQSHHQPAQRRVENGTTGTIDHAGKDGQLTIQTTGANPRQVSVNTTEFQGLKLAYAQHVYKAQGITVENAQVLIGGWQTDRERAYVALSRARERTDIHIARTDLGEQGLDQGAIDRLGQTIQQSNAQHASITRQTQPREAETRERNPPHSIGAEPPEPRQCEQPDAAERQQPSAGERQPLSEVGRILQDQEEHERQAEREHGLGFGIE